MMAATRYGLKLCGLIVAAVVSLCAASLLGPAVDSFLDAHAGEAGGGEISCVLSETGGQDLIYTRWPDFDRPVAVGSLVKPFTALAYAESHGGRFPRIPCTPQSGCWLPAGHGLMDIQRAIAHSCNAYFRSISEQLGRQDLAAVTARFGISPPPLQAAGGAFFGLGDDWRIAPASLVRAYQELLKRAAEPAVKQIIAGLKDAAGQGTAAGVSRALGGPTALAKTGTAPCVHRGGTLRRSNGDGYALVLYPAEQPRYTLLVRVHGGPGREAANLAGEILRVVGLGSAPAGIVGSRHAVLAK
jgi:hypothetical protein